MEAAQAVEDSCGSGLVRATIGFFAANTNKEMDAILVDLTGALALSFALVRVSGSLNASITRRSCRLQGVRFQGIGLNHRHHCLRDVFIQMLRVFKS